MRFVPEGNAYVDTRQRPVPPTDAPNTGNAHHGGSVLMMRVGNMGSTRVTVDGRVIRANLYHGRSQALCFHIDSTLRTTRRPYRVYICLLGHLNF